MTRFGELGLPAQHAEFRKVSASTTICRPWTLPATATGLAESVELGSIVRVPSGRQPDQLSTEIDAGIDDGESLFADTNRDNAAFRELVGGNEPKSRMVLIGEGRRAGHLHVGYTFRSDVDQVPAFPTGRGCRTRVSRSTFSIRGRRSFPESPFMRAPLSGRKNSEQLLCGIQG